MTADKMPLMLDNTMSVDLNDVDDLFGDVGSLSLPTRGSGKKIQQRMDQLRAHGCQQTVAWSKSGSIASISQDGELLELRFLRCHPENGTWDLGEATVCDLVKGTPSIPLVHLEWSPSGASELAVFDAVGRVTLISFSILLNNGISTRSWEGDTVDDLSTVVGCHWLNVAPSNQQKPYNVLYGPAKRHGNGFQYENSFVAAGGPHHPHPGKSALFCVTMNGMLKMYWSQNNNRIEETTAELESASSSDDLVTHASLASDKRSLLIALATANKKLRFLKLEIQWAGPGAVQEKSQLSQTSRLNPSLVETHLATTELCSVDVGDELSTAELSQLYTLPSLVDNTGKNTSTPIIIAVRTTVSGTGTFQVAQSILDRWEVVEERQTLGTAFEQLGTRRNSVSSELPTNFVLKKLEPIIINKTVIGVHPIQFGKVLLLAMADGTVEQRDRFTFEELQGEQEAEKISDLRQIGWNFSDEGTCQQVAFSPTACSKIQLGEDNKLRWSKLQYSLGGDIGNTMQDKLYANTIAGLAIATAGTVWYNGSFDDLIALVHVQGLAEKKRFGQDWVGEMVRILKIQVDYGGELHHDSLMRNSHLRSCLSIMSSLGFTGEFRPRSLPSKFANVNLNMRNVVILVTLASNTPESVRDKMNPLDEPDVVNTLVGCVKWSLDLLSWVTESLFELMNDSAFMELLVPQRFPEMAAYLQEKNDISLHLMLCSCSRSFLSAICRRIAHLEDISRKAIEFYKRQPERPGGMGSSNNHLQQAYQHMQQATASSLIKVSEFEKLLNVLGGDVRQTYQQFLPNAVKGGANPPTGKTLELAVKSAQVQLELYMLLAKSPTPAFAPIIQKFFTKDLKAFRAMTDPANLFFYDFSLLGEEDDEKSLASRKQRGVRIDIFKKIELRVGVNQLLPWRRCVRCTAVMEDANGAKPGFSFVLGQQRKCACGGSWALLPKGKLIP